MTKAAHRARALAVALKEVRERAGFSQRKVATALGRHHTTISRWEDGSLSPSSEDVAAYLAVLGVTGAERARILTLARTNDESDWLISGPPGISPQLASVMDYERTAVRIFEWAPLVIPGLLQTPDYANAIMSRSSASIPAHEVEARVMVRMGRQSAVTRLDPVELHAAIGLPAIYGRTGGSRVMAAQLRHLTEMGDRSNVTVQAYDLTAPWTPAHAGEFILYEFADLPPVVYLEHHRTGAFVVDEQDVADYQTAADIIRREAMSPDETTELIANTVIPSMETTI